MIVKATVVTVLLGLALDMALSGCASPQPVSNAPGLGGPLSGTIVQGLQDSAWNLDQAKTIGVLPDDDPADQCVHGLLKQMGADVGTGVAADAKQFTPRISDLLSGGSVLYIRAQQAKALAATGMGVPDTCEALIGRLVIDASRLGLKVGGSLVPGVGILSPVLGR